MHFPAKTLPQKSEDQKRIGQSDSLSFRRSHRFGFKGQNYLGELEVNPQVLSDTAIFSRVLYQLSYLGPVPFGMLHGRQKTEA